MHLRSITLKGFKSFPTRTRLEFGSGVSVIVGPNGSGKSNITDAVLWALGEQSPLAVRGQSMKDVIFAGGHGLQGARSAEVEVVIDNRDGRLESGFSEISIVRRLEHDGEGEYRLNGARCRLVDVIEVLSDSGLGKEMHSVVSQGKVEQIVLSRPRERRLLIEEAAGLGKHRKRRRRAQLKLERTEENLSRALDVEREARSRLRPLKRQAEAADLHARLERQTLEARLALSRDAARSARLALAAAEQRASAARGERDEAERLLAEVARHREQAEEAFAAQTRDRERLQGRLYAARSAAERIAMRLERVREQAAAAYERRGRRLRQLEVLEQEAAAAADAREPLPDERLPRPPASSDREPGPDARMPRPPAATGRMPDARTQAGGAEPGIAWGELTPDERIRSFERELAALNADREERLTRELAGMEAELEAARERRAELERVAAERRRALEAAEEAAEGARAARRQAEREAESARSRAAEVGAELAAANKFVRGAAGAPDGARPFAEELRVTPGYELALSAVLGPRLTAGIVANVTAAAELLDRAGRDGGSVLVEGVSVPAPAADRADDWAGSTVRPPIESAEPLLNQVRPEPAAAPLAQRLLRNVWVVESLDALPDGFAGVAVTRAGRLFDARVGELSQAPAEGPDRLLREIARREELVAASAEAAAKAAEVAAALERAAAAVADADAVRETAEGALRSAMRAAAEAEEEVGRREWVLGRRRAAPEDGPEAVRRAELVADLRAERRLAARAAQERAERAHALEALRGGADDDLRMRAEAERAARALEAASSAVAGRRDALQAELDAGAAAGEETAARLRACAHEEAELQGRLKRASDALTGAEVAAQQQRDAAADVERELVVIARRLGLEPAAPSETSGAAAIEAAAEPLNDDERHALEVRVERLERRREQLGPVNPLAQQEYEEEVEHVEELEAQRGDLEAALAELESLIKETDRRIREAFEETFAAAAGNFQEVVQHLFPGGRGRLRLVQAEQGPRPLIGGAEAPATESESGEPVEDDQPEAGVEIEVTPPGKSTKRLSLLSGGEKSLVALAFMFAVFLARPCPFYILDEVEAALDDINIDRFLELVKRYSDRAQFIVVTHQKRTMDAADTLYGVSMGGDGVSRVVSRRLGGEAVDEAAA